MTSTEELSPERSAQVSEIIAEFSDAFALARRRWARLAEEMHPDLRGAAVLVLQVIARKGPVTATGISHQLDMDKATVSRLVSQLRELEFVETESAAEDRRVTLLTATTSGTATIDSMRGRAAEDYHARFEAWDDDALEQLRAGLHRYNAFVPETVDGPAKRCAQEHGGGLAGGGE